MIEDEDESGIKLCTTWSFCFGVVAGRMKTDRHHCFVSGDVPKN